jgi:hypothetical protein
VKTPNDQTRLHSNPPDRIAKPLAS